MWRGRAVGYQPIGREFEPRWKRFESRDCRFEFSWGWHERWWHASRGPAWMTQTAVPAVFPDIGRRLTWCVVDFTGQEMALFHLCFPISEDVSEDADRNNRWQRQWIGATVCFSFVSHCFVFSCIYCVVFSFIYSVLVFSSLYSLLCFSWYCSLWMLIMISSTFRQSLRMQRDFESLMFWCLNDIDPIELDCI